MATNHRTPLLAIATVDLLQSPGSVVHVATRDANLRPHLAYVYGCHVDTGTARLTVGLSRPAASDVVADVGANAAVALVACNIRNFQTVQLKGSDARIEAADDAARRRAVEFHRGFVEVSTALGYVRPVMDRHMGIVAADLITLKFTVSQAFVQTPGANAGAPLAAGAVGPGAR